MRRQSAIGHLLTTVSFDPRRDESSIACCEAIMHVDLNYASDETGCGSRVHKQTVEIVYIHQLFHIYQRHFIIRKEPYIGRRIKVQLNKTKRYHKKAEPLHQNALLVGLSDEKHAPELNDPPSFGFISMPHRHVL